MNEQAKTALLSFLIECAEHLVLHPPEKPESGISWPQADGRVFHLPEPWAQQFKERVNRLARQDPWSERFTEKYIRNCFSFVMFKVHDDGDSAASGLLDHAISMLNGFSDEQTVYVPVTGVELAIPELRLGRVVLKYFDDNLFSMFTSRLDAHLQVDTDDQTTQERLAQLKQYARERLHGKVCAEFRAIAEPDRAIERAQEEARRAVELITFACVALLPADAPQQNIVIGLDGEVPRLGPLMLSFSDSDVTTSQSSPISAMPITINEESVIGLQSVGVMALSEMLSRSSPSGKWEKDWEKDLLRAVHWLAASQAQVELENRLLNLITAMETLLTGGEKGIRANMAESVALLTMETYEDRRRVKSFVAKMYSARSGVTHGRKQEVSESQVNQLRRTVADLITKLVDRKDVLSTKEKLNAWLEQKRLGA